MDFVRGGNLFQLLCKKNYIPEVQAKFYAVQIISAFGHLHKCNIVYRDLKLENVMLGEDGYVSLIDFGMARYLEKGELSSSICGTKQYMAPEMIEQKGHSFSLDWWTLGIFLFEMLFGNVPFLPSDLSDEKLIKMIKKKQVKFPPLKFLTQHNPVS